MAAEEEVFNLGFKANLDELFASMRTGLTSSVKPLSDALGKAADSAKNLEALGISAGKAMAEEMKRANAAAREAAKASADAAKAHERELERMAKDAERTNREIIRKQAAEARKAAQEQAAVARVSARAQADARESAARSERRHFQEMAAREEAKQKLLEKGYRQGSDQLSKLIDLRAELVKTFGKEAAAGSKLAITYEKLDEKIEEAANRKVSNRGRTLSMLFDEMKGVINQAGIFGQVVSAMAGDLFDLGKAGGEAAEGARDIAREYAESGKQLKLVDGGAAGAARSLGGLSTAGLVAGGVVAALAVAATAAGVAAVGMAQDLAGNIKELDKAAAFAGVATDALSRYTILQQRTGIEANELGEIFAELGDKANELAMGNEDLAIALQRMGISTDAFLKMNPEERLQAVADGFLQIEDSGQRSSAIMTIFGDDLAKKVAPALAGGAKGIREMLSENDRLGLSIDANTVKVGKEYTEAVQSLKNAWKGFSQSIAADVLPMVTGLVDALASLTGSKQQRSAEQVTRDNLKQLEKQYDDLNKAVEKAFKEGDKERVAELATKVADYAFTIGSLKAQLDKQKEAQKQANAQTQAAVGLSVAQSDAVASFAEQLAQTQAATLEGEAALRKEREASLIALKQEFEEANRSGKGSAELTRLYAERKKAIEAQYQKELKDLREKETEEWVKELEKREKSTKDFAMQIPGMFEFDFRKSGFFKGIDATLKNGGLVKYDLQPIAQSIGQQLVGALSGVKVPFTAALLGTSGLKIGDFLSDGLKAFGVTAVDTGNRVGKVVKKIYSGIKAIVGAGVDLLKSMGAGAMKIADGLASATGFGSFMDVLRGGPEKAKEFAAALGGLDLSGMIKNFAGAFVIAIRGISENLGDIGYSVVDGIVEALPAVVAALPRVFGALQGTLSGGLLPAIFEAFNGALVFLATEGIPQVLSLATTFVMGIIENLPTILPALIAAGGVLVIGIVKALPQLTIALVKALPEILVALAKGIGAVILELVATVVGVFSESAAASIRKAAGGLIGATSGGEQSLQSTQYAGVQSSTSAGMATTTSTTPAPGSTSSYKYDTIQVTDAVIPASGRSRTVVTAPGDDVFAYQKGGINDLAALQRAGIGVGQEGNALAEEEIKVLREILAAIRRLGNRQVLAAPPSAKS